MIEKTPRGLPKLLLGISQPLAVQIKADIISEARQKGIEFMLYAIPGTVDPYWVQSASIIEHEPGEFLTMSV